MWAGCLNKNLWQKKNRIDNSNTRNAATKCSTLIPGKVGHVLQSKVLICCILIQFLFLGFFCQSIHSLDVDICRTN